MVLLWFAAVLGCAVAAGELLRLVEHRDGATSFDSSIITWLVAHRTHGVTLLARRLSTLGSQYVLLPVSAIVAVALLVRRRLVLAGLLVVAWGGALSLYSLTKYVVSRHRPPEALWLTKASGTSFPSGHATQSLCTFLALAVVGAVWLRRRRVATTLALVLAAGVGWSRMYLGVHWASDVGAGWLIAAAWAAIVVSLARRAPSAARPRGAPG